METLRNVLDRLSHNHQKNISTDPIFFPHQFQNAKNREIAAFISAMFAFGNIKTIFTTLENIFEFLGKNPHQKILSLDRTRFQSHMFAKHRWITTSDTKNFLLLLKNILSSHGNLENSFLKFKSESLEKSLSDWMSYLLLQQIQIQKHGLSRGQKFLLSSPKGKSASKRLLMFMRWMVRDESPDLGLWKSVSPSELFIPLDTHLFAFSHHLGFTKRKQPGWPAVVEISQAFKKINPKDPIRYDFALARLGIEHLCIHAKDDQYCRPCLLRKHCKLHQK